MMATGDLRQPFLEEFMDDCGDISLFLRGDSGFTFTRSEHSTNNVRQMVYPMPFAERKVNLYER